MPPRRIAQLVESFIRHRVPPDAFSALAAFDGSGAVERTAGEVSARGHGEEANCLAGGAQPRPREAEAGP
jgi:hypothetical protein